MNGMVPTTRAILFRFEPICIFLLVSRGRVVPFLAVGALQNDDVPHL